MNSKNKTRVLASVAMLSAISYVLAFIELPVPLSPSFAKMDISDFPALIAAFGAFIPFIKSKLDVVLVERCTV